MNYEQAATQLEQIIASDASLDKKMQQALRLGNEYLGTSMAIISRVDRLAYYVYRHDTPPNTLSDGQVFSLGVTYCQLTLARNRLVAVSHAALSVFQNHPAYQQMGLETYIGVPLHDANQQRLGTLNFSASERRTPTFDHCHEQFVQQMADWLSQQLVHREDYLHP